MQTLLLPKDRLKLHILREPVISQLSILVKLLFLCWHLIKRLIKTLDLNTLLGTLHMARFVLTADPHMCIKITKMLLCNGKIVLQSKLQQRYLERTFFFQNIVFTKKWLLNWFLLQPYGLR